MSTIGTQEAAQLLRMSTDALMRKARAGIVPADKPGREWVFIKEDLLAWLRKRAQERACHCIANLRARTGSSDSQLAAQRLDAALKRLRAKPPKNSSPSFALICGGKSGLENARGTPGPKRSSAGTTGLTVVTKTAKGSA